jgi:aminoglycoside phosphotransferase
VAHGARSQSGRRPGAASVEIRRCWTGDGRGEHDRPVERSGRLRNGYTNETSAEGTNRVRKIYTGSDAAERAATERACLAELRGVLPVPAVTDSDRASIVMELLPGRHGQELIDAGYGAAVMRSTGTILRELQSVRANVLPSLPGSGPVLVHGDFGPQNMLFDEWHQVTAVLDWEFAHRGNAIEDLAWAEWIVRMHHPAYSDVVSELFAGYGHRPPWKLRHRSMLARCDDLLRRCFDEGQHEAATMWADRLKVTKRWADLPASTRPSQ